MTSNPELFKIFLKSSSHKNVIQILEEIWYEEFQGFNFCIKGFFWVYMDVNGDYLKYFLRENTQETALTYHVHFGQVEESAKAVN